MPAAVVASGTATLETALMQVPQVVIYKVGWLTSMLFPPSCAAQVCVTSEYYPTGVPCQSFYKDS